jgi:probable rRNA maturation factor
MKRQDATSSVVDIDQQMDLRHRIDGQWLNSYVSRALAAFNHPIARVGVMILDDARVAQLHQEHCNVAGTTDVLTFPQSKAGETIVADIAVNADEAARRAAEFGHRIERELLLYVVHGLLHCAGYDDHDTAAYERMHAEEDRILEAIGVGATFRPQSTSRDSAGGDAPAAHKEPRA